ncbi:MAG: RNA degradosome polyphosphate kinase [Clostridiales bacterium]|nr:RNA degradosome polyphosphate kinase [Clostridiales bacterium]
MADLNNTDLYINRELSWLEFNERVLEEAFDKTNPILERFKFLAITASNMDEFFMVRVAGLMEQVYAGKTSPDISGLTPDMQLEKIAERTHEMAAKQYNCLNRSLIPALKEDKIFFKKYKELNSSQKDFAKAYFNTTLFPILTPMAIDSSRPFPLVFNKSLNLIVELESEDEKEDKFAVVEVPSVVPRIIELPMEGENRIFIFLEDIIKHFISRLFEGNKVLSACAFRITRNSDLEIDEDERHDLLMEIEQSIKKRKWGEPVRLEIEKNIADSAFRFLLERLELNSSYIYRINGIIDLTAGFLIAGISGCSGLCDEPMPPVAVKAFRDKDMFEVIKEKDILVHHPYESFDCVVNFVKTAAKDPLVLAIKQTLYRVSGNSPIISALIQAAENGKQVTVLVELKARFDEENNINWARKLEKAGCHVVYGLVGLKTHCKLCMVVRKESEGIRRYVHLGTGNYNDKTAKQYTDLGMFTAKESYGADVSKLFNVLTGYSKSTRYQEIAAAPTNLREMFIKNIETEAQNAREGKEAKILAKMNSLVDDGIVKALYEAAMAGVEIHLVVRGICCLRPGVTGVSENIQVTSIVGRFLEHSRIYYFENGGSPKIYLSSADWMSRNLNRRVEVAFAVEDERLKKEVTEILKITLSDTIKTRVMESGGTYKRVDKRGKEPIHSQLLFYENAKEKNRPDPAQKHDIFAPITSENRKPL